MAQTDRQTDRQTNRQTWRLLDQLGPVGPCWWKVQSFQHPSLFLVPWDCHIIRPSCFFCPLLLLRLIYILFPYHVSQATINFTPFYFFFALAAMDVPISILKLHNEAKLPSLLFFLVGALYGANSIDGTLFKSTNKFMGQLNIWNGKPQIDSHQNMQLQGPN